MASRWENVWGIHPFVVLIQELQGSVAARISQKVRKSHSVRLTPAVREGEFRVRGDPAAEHLLHQQIQGAAERLDFLEAGVAELCDRG